MAGNDTVHFPAVGADPTVRKYAPWVARVTAVLVGVTLFISDTSIRVICGGMILFATLWLVTHLGRACDQLDELKNGHFSHCPGRMAQLKAESEIANTKNLELVKSLEIKSETIAWLCHEIRNALHIMLCNARFLLEHIHEADDVKHTQTILDSGNQMRSLIDETLDSEKIQHHKMVLKTIPFNLHHVLQKLYEQNLERSREANVQLKLHIDDGTPQFIYGDFRRIHQVLSNLVTNAIKFTPRNGIVVIRSAKGEHGKTCSEHHCTLHAGKPPVKPADVAKVVDHTPIAQVHVGLGETHENTRIVLSMSKDLKADTPLLDLGVCDDGVGVSANSMPLLFQTYIQAKESATREYGGTGLGLSIVKMLIQLMGGCLLVGSTVGKGSCFSVRIPYSVAESANYDSQKHLPDSPICQCIRCAPSLSPLHTPTVGGGGGPATLLRPRLLHKQSHSDPAVSPLKLASPFLANSRLPVKQNFSLLDHANTKEMDSVASTVVPSTSVAPPMVLLVEDQVINQKLVIQMLKGTCSVDVANNGLEAVHRVDEKKGQYSCILMDLSMPVMNGHDATKEIRRRGYTLPIIALTGNLLDIAERERGFHAGLTAFLQKPYEKKELICTISPYLAK